MSQDFVWVLTGHRANFPSGVFSTRDAAERVIRANKLTGTLTRYPLDRLSYEWAITEGYFKPKRPDQQTPEFMSKFASGEEHYHYLDGV